MEWVQKLNESMEYIESRLSSELDYDQLARIACCSRYHYQRMFTYLAGTTLSEYVRRRRMSLAAVDLQNGEGSVLEIAGKYGYSSPTAFNRAFQSVHGVAPSAVRGTGAAVKSYPPMVFTLSVRGGQAMDYRIESHESFRVVGVSAPLEQDLESNFQTVPQLWQRAAADGTIQRLAGLMDAPPKGLLGISVCGEAERWRYYIAVSSTRPAGELETYTVPAFDWAVFPGTGMESFQDLERRVVTEWLPSSGYEYADGPDLEVYLDPNPQNARYEIWIPVVRQRESGEVW